MDTIVEAADHERRPRQPEPEQTRSIAFSWFMTMNLPTLKQTRIRSLGPGLSDPWIDSKPFETKPLA